MVDRVPRESSLRARVATDVEPLILQLDDRHFERVGRFEAAQQIVSALMLLGAAYDRYEAADGALPVFALALSVPGVALLIAAVREIRGRGSRHVNWLNLAAGVTLLAAWGVSVSEGAKLFQPSLVAGILSILVGIFHVRLQRVRLGRRRLRIDAEGISAWVHPFRRFRIRWADVEWVAADADALRFGRGNGPAHRLPLGRFRNAGDVSAAIVAACRTRDIDIRIPLQPLTASTHAE